MNRSNFKFIFVTHYAKAHNSKRKEANREKNAAQ